MHQNGNIWYFLAIFVAGTFRPLSERASCRTDVLISPIWKNGEDFIAKKSPKIEKMAVLSVILAILGYFSRFSPNDHTDICLSEQQDFTESTLLLYILRDISILRLNILKTRENGHNMHQNGHIWYFLAIFVAGTFRPSSECASCQTDALISPIWKNCEGFGNLLWCFIFWNIRILRLNILKNRENGHNMHQNGHIWYFLAIFIAGTFQPLCEHAACQTDALISPIWKNCEGFIAKKCDQKLKIWPF